MVCVVVIVQILTLISKHRICLIRVLFAGYDYVVTVKVKTQYAGVYCYRFPYLFVGFPQLVRRNIIMFMSSPIFLYHCFIINQLHLT